MTSLGFEDSLDPYRITEAEIACVLKGGAFVTEHNKFERVVTGIKDGAVIGYKYYDFGLDNGNGRMYFSADITGLGADCNVHIRIDSEDGEEIGSFKVGHGNGVYKTEVKPVSDRHAVFLTVDTDYTGWTAAYFKERPLFELKRFVFTK